MARSRLHEAASVPCIPHLSSSPICVSEKREGIVKEATIIAIVSPLVLLSLAIFSQSHRSSMTHGPAHLTVSEASNASPLNDDRTDGSSQDPNTERKAPAPPPPPPPPSPSGGDTVVQSAAEPKRTLIGVTSGDLKRIERYLPIGARIYTYPVDESSLASALISADLDGDGKAETIAVYNDRKPTAEEGSLPLTLTVLVREKNDLAVRSSVRLSGDVFFSPYIRGLGPPLAVRDITGDGRQEIVVVSGGGASLGGDLQVFSFDGSSLRELARVGGHFFQLRSAENGKPSIITARSRYETVRRTYKWTGKSFEETAKRPPK